MGRQNSQERSLAAPAGQLDGRRHQRRYVMSTLRNLVMQAGEGLLSNVVCICLLPCMNMNCRARQCACTRENGKQVYVYYSWWNWTIRIEPEHMQPASSFHSSSLAWFSSIRILQATLLSPSSVSQQQIISNRT